MKIAYEKCADFQWVQWDQCCLILAWLLFPFNRFEIHFQPHWSLIKVKGIISGLYYIFHHSVPLTHRHQWQWICDHRHSIFTSPMRHNHNKNQGASSWAMHLDLHYNRILIIQWRMSCILAAFSYNRRNLTPWNGMTLHCCWLIDRFSYNGKCRYCLCG